MELGWFFLPFSLLHDRGYSLLNLNLLKCSFVHKLKAYPWICEMACQRDGISVVTYRIIEC